VRLATALAEPIANPDPDSVTFTKPITFAHPITLAQPVTFAQPTGQLRIAEWIHDRWAGGIHMGGEPL
jgi:hypothetical protein